MGGTQSAPPNSASGIPSQSKSTPPISESETFTSNEELSISDQRQPFVDETVKRQNPELSGWELVQHKCRRKKKRYEKCWNSWYKDKFLVGQQLDRDCDDLFESWRTCVLKQMKEQREREGLGPAHKESALGELEDEDK